MDFEFDQVAPVRDPLVEQRAVVRLHDLVTATQLLVDPTGHVGEAFGGEASLRPKTAIHRGGVAVPEVFDDHVEAFHVGNLSRRAWSAIRPQVVRPCALTHAIAASGGRLKRTTSAAAMTTTAGVETMADTCVGIKMATINSAAPM